MILMNKLLRAGDLSRNSRFHTLRGQLIPISEIITIPLELTLRILRLYRKGPWLCRPAIRVMNQLITNNEQTRMLEIGGGRSSRYFARRVSFLTTIEEDKDWATRIVQMVSDENCNFEIEVTSVESWLLTRNKTNMNFDLVLIDGSTDAVRKKAIERLPSLNPAAVYILDNSDRKIFNDLDFVLEPTKVLRKHGLVRHPFQATETTFYWFL